MTDHAINILLILLTKTGENLGFRLNFVIPPKHTMVKSLTSELKKCQFYVTRSRSSNCLQL